MKCAHCNDRIVKSPSARDWVHADTLSRNCPAGGTQAEPAVRRNMA